MSEPKMKTFKQTEKPIPAPLRRLICSFDAMLKRTYPDPEVRRAVSERIMQEFVARQTA